MGGNRRGTQRREQKFWEGILFGEWAGLFAMLCTHLCARLMVLIQ
jgi:hypothetical protein